VAFHFNVPDKLAYACRLIRKARRKGARLVVYGESAQLDALSPMLWQLAPLEFLPHASRAAPARVAERSPVVLRARLHGDEVADVLVNLAADLPEGHQRFNRLIEVVSLEATDREAARVRWKAHVTAGLVPERFDLAQAPQD
jgi:DNA polymerase-3 subunit chi